MKCIVTVPLCPMMESPSPLGEQTDELLLGWEVEAGDCPAPGWRRVETCYRYTGYARETALLPGAAAESWGTLPKKTVLRGVCDVQCAPAFRAPTLLTLPRGALLSPMEPTDGDGWQKVSLPDGREGFLRGGCLGEHYTAPAFREEDRLRAAIVAAARSYLGVQYRWGGRTPYGVDCSGLASMAYLLCGVRIFRDARVAEGFPIRPIPREALRPADLLYFPGHVALCLGEGRYIHSTGRAGSDGVVVNSLLPAHPDYREDLDRLFLTGGSLFGPA